MEHPADGRETLVPSDRGVLRARFPNASFVSQSSGAAEPLLPAPSLLDDVPGSLDFLIGRARAERARPARSEPKPSEVRRSASRRENVRWFIGFKFICYLL